MRTTSFIAAMALLLAATAGPALGSAFSFDEQGAKASAQAGAFTARADDPSAVFYNPAAITRLEGTQFTLGMNGVLTGNGDYRSFTKGEKKSDQRGDINFTPTLYMTHRISDRISFGVGVFSPFLLDAEWEDGFEGRFLARETKLLTGAVKPALAFALGDNWSVAVGAEYVYADIKLTRNLDFSSVPSAFCPDANGDGTLNDSCEEGFLRLDDQTDGWGGGAAIHFRSDNGYSWGLNWTSQVVLHFDSADVKAQDVLPGVDAFACGGSSCFPDQKASSSFRLPQSFATGFGIEREKWDLEADVVWYDWELFEGFNFDYSENTALLSDDSGVPDWDSGLSYRLGGAYSLNDRIELRAGVSYDDTPVPDKTLGPQIPDSSSTSAHIGYGYNSESGKFRFDAYMKYERLSDSSTSSNLDGLNGRYTGSRNTLGFAATWICGKRG